MSGAQTFLGFHPENGMRNAYEEIERSGLVYKLKQRIRLTHKGVIHHFEKCQINIFSLLLLFSKPDTMEPLPLIICVFYEEQLQQVANPSQTNPNYSG